MLHSSRLEENLSIFLPEHTMLDLEGEFGLEEVSWPILLTQCRLVRPGLNLEENCHARIEPDKGKRQNVEICLLMPTNSRALSVAANLRKDKLRFISLLHIFC